MTRRHRIWLAVATVFFALNLGAAGFAFGQGELPHAGIHVMLALLGAYLAWYIASRRTARSDTPAEEVRPTEPAEFGGRLTNLEQSVDAVAVEVERIGEGQRFVTRLVAEGGAAPARGDGATQPEESAGREAAAPAARP